MNCRSIFAGHDRHPQSCRVRCIASVGHGRGHTVVGSASFSAVRVSARPTSSVSQGSSGSGVVASCASARASSRIQKSDPASVSLRMHGEQRSVINAASHLPVACMLVQHCAARLWHRTVLQCVMHKSVLSSVGAPYRRRIAAASPADCTRAEPRSPTPARKQTT